MILFDGSFVDFLEVFRMGVLDLSSLSDDQLLVELKTRVQRERDATDDVIFILKEVEDRQLPIKRGFSSLFKFLTVELKYSESCAQRRIQAIRFIKSVGPELGEKVSDDLKSGDLSLATLCNVQSALWQEEKEARRVAGKSEVQAFLSAQDKVELLSNLKGKTSDEVQKALGDHSQNTAAALGLPVPTLNMRKRRGGKRIVSSKDTEVKVVLDTETMEMLQELKLQFSHKLKDSNSYSELMSLVIHSAWATIVPAAKTTDVQASTVKEKKVPSPKPQSHFPSTQPTKRFSRYIPVAVHRAVMTRDGNCCNYKEPVTGRVCGSKYKIQLDHIVPFAVGGEATVENLQARCQSHNQLAAVQFFGADHMRQFTSTRKSARSLNLA